MSGAPTGGRPAALGAQDRAKDKESDRKGILKRQVLSELNATLQVHSQKMKLLRKAGDVDLAAGTDVADSEAVSVQFSGQVARATSPRVQIAGSTVGAHQDTTTVSRIPTLAKRASQKRTATIKFYRPEYTWNRGGRLKELRIRTIARKFFNGWKLKTFGKVLPSIASQHYQQKIAREAFEEWRDLWWTSRKEWRLMVRAECHDRYRLWNRTWKAWRLYTAWHRSKTARMSAARLHYNSKCTLWAWQSWRLHSTCEKAKAADYKMALAFLNRSRITLFWHKWKTCLENRHFVSSEEARALGVWATSLMQKYWVCWRSEYAKRDHDQGQLRLAGAHWEQHVKRTAWSTWCSFIRDRCEKKDAKADVDRLHHQRLQRRYFTLWQRRYAAVQAVVNLEGQITMMARKAVLRRVLIHWKHYILLHRDRVWLMEKAQVHNQHRLLKASFVAIRYAVIRKRIKSMRSSIADHFHTRQVMLQAWTTWISRCNLNEELKMYPKTKRAYEHYEMQIQRKTFDAWKTYLSWRKHRSEESQQASTFFYLRIMPRCFGQWRTYVDLVKWKTHAAQVADDTDRRTVLTRCFYHWLSSLESLLEHREMERMAILQYEHVLQARSLCLWRQRTEEKLDTDESMVLACEHHARRLSCKVLAKLKAEVLFTKQQAAHMAKAAAHEQQKRLRLALSSWSTYVQKCKRKRRLKARAADFHIRAVTRKPFQAWVACWQATQQKLTKADEAVGNRNAAELRVRWQQWLRYVARRKLTKRKQKQAALFHQRQTLAKVMRNWKAAASRQSTRRLEDTWRMERVHQAADSVLLRRCLSAWRLARDDRLLQRLKYQQAVEYCNRKLATAAVQWWRQQIQLGQRKKLLARQAVFANGVRLLGQSIGRWKLQLSEQRARRAKDAVALWQWSLVLERKCLVAWFCYAENRRRKKARYQAALAVRRLRLTRECAHRWLVASALIHATRTKLAALRRAEGAFDLFQAVLRCFLHWREWTARRRKVVPMASQGCSRAGRITGAATGAVTRATLCVGSKAGLARQSGAPLDAAIGSATATAVSPPRRPRPAPRLPTFLMQSLERFDMGGLLGAAGSSSAVVPRAGSEARHQQQQQQALSDAGRMPTTQRQPLTTLERAVGQGDGPATSALGTNAHRQLVTRAAGHEQRDCSRAERLQHGARSQSLSPHHEPRDLSSSAAAAGEGARGSAGSLQLPSMPAELGSGVPEPRLGWRSTRGPATTGDSSSSRVHAPPLVLLPPSAFLLPSSQETATTAVPPRGGAGDILDEAMPTMQQAAGDERSAEQGGQATDPAAAAANDQPIRHSSTLSRQELLELHEKMLALRDARALLKKKKKRINKLSLLVDNCRETDVGDALGEAAVELSELQSEADVLARDVDRMTVECRRLAALLQFTS